MKKIIALLLALVMVMSLAACGAKTEAPAADAPEKAPAAEKDASASAENITLRFSWWGSDSRHQATLDIIELYESLNPGVTIEAEYGGADGYKDKRMTEMAGGNAPDIMQIDSPWLSDLTKQFEPFADLSKFNIDMSGFDSAFVNDHGAVDGVIYGLPTGINGTYMLLNTAVLDAAGIAADQDWTWAKILSEGAKVHQADPEAYFMNLDQHCLYYHVLRVYIKQLTGKQLMNEDYTMGFTEEQLVEGLKYIKALFDEGVMQPASESFMYIDAFYDNPIWVNNKVACDVDWSSMLTARKAGFADTAAVAAVPQLDGGLGTGVLCRPAQILCVSSTSKYQEVAADFINFMLNDPRAISIEKLERSVPATEQARAQLAEEGELDPQVADAVNLALAIAGPAENTVAQNMQLENIMTDAVEKIGYGLATPEEVAAETMVLLQAKLDELKAS